MQAVAVLVGRRETTAQYNVHYFQTENWIKLKTFDTNFLKKVLFELL